MNTLIELYDDRPIENVLASEVFRPKRTIFLCTKEIAQNKTVQSKMQEYFRHLGLNTELIFLESSMYHTSKLERQFRSLVSQYPGCVADITGGTDAALFACGIVCAELDIPVFTYSRKKNCFFNIHNADFADGLPCTVSHSVESCFMMAGGAFRKGRVDNNVLGKYIGTFDRFFRLYLKYRTEWNKAVSYIQSVSQNGKDQSVSLKVNAPVKVSGPRGSKVSAPEGLLRSLEGLGYLKKLTFADGRVSFSFMDAQIRNWLRDIGSVLELYVYKECLESGLFQEVCTSAVVDWEGDFKKDNVTNEIDVIAMRGILPLFISCKTCAVDTDALNELAILRDRFGGEGSKALIVTTQRCRSITRHRAFELDIEVIDLDDLKAGGIGEHIRTLLMRE